LSASLEPTPQNIAKIARLAGDLIFETIVIEREIANPHWNHRTLVLASSIQVRTLLLYSLLMVAAMFLPCLF
jgi:hypothetical protein